MKCFRDSLTTYELLILEKNKYTIKVNNLESVEYSLISMRIQKVYKLYRSMVIKYEALERSFCFRIKYLFNLAILRSPFRILCLFSLVCKRQPVNIICL